MVRALPLLFAALALLPSTLLAHGVLKSSVPAKDAHVDSAPSELRLTFAATSTLSVTRLRLIGPDGAMVLLGPLRHADGDSAHVVVAEVRGRMSIGTYVVEWQSVGADGHPVRGNYSFMVMNDPPAGSTAETHAMVMPSDSGGPPHLMEMAGETHGFNAESPAFVLIRWITFLALVALIGVVFFHSFVLRRLGAGTSPALPAAVLAAARARAARLGYWAAVTLGLAALARLGAQAYAVFGADALDLRLLASLLGSLLGGTIWGTAWMMQVGAVIAVLAGFSRVRHAHADGWGVVTIGAVVLAVTPALSGHAVAVPDTAPLSVLADTVHVLGASGWIGTLALIFFAGIPALRPLPAGEFEHGVALLVRAFSPVALVCAAALALSGVFAAWVHLGSVAALWQPGYGRTLAIKLGLLGIVGVTGLYNWRRVTPTLETSLGVARLRRTVIVELSVAVMVLLATAVLVATPTPMD